jgi:aerobic-type carbon monoxide dehydrogenase small subunit (CoxS/CutS family)
MESTARTIEFTLNGRPVRAPAESHLDLVDLLRRFDLFGARESCGQGLCGCCTVLIDGKAVSGCPTLAQLVDGKSVATVESLDSGGALSFVQQAFIDEGAFQCGFCTPGFLLMIHQLLEHIPDPDEEQIKDYLAGNLCRCTAYPRDHPSGQECGQQPALHASGLIHKTKNLGIIHEFNTFDDGIDPRRTMVQIDQPQATEYACCIEPRVVVRRF